MPNDRNPVKPFVKAGEQLGYVAVLKKKGLWPPRLHNPKDNNNHDRRAVTPYLVIPAFPGDNGARPAPDSLVFHNRGVWLEDAAMPGVPVDFPQLGKEFLVKCRIVNLGATGSYGGLADFYFNKPATFTADAASNIALPALGHTGFSVLQGQMVVVTCPHKWKPTSAADLAGSFVVHAFDPFTDMINARYDARHDRHVGRHDFSSDFYVRDWTDSAALHDQGQEPSSNPVFYHTSDIWNRRSDTPGPFVNDQPENQNPQAGAGSAGDNWVFARVSRNSAQTEEKVFAHFLFAEFGTGSPYQDCSSDPDPSVVFLVGETSKTLSLKWHLHPSSSTHLCLGVQVYSEADPYLTPGLLGYTPGWPTDMMVVSDNNKAQRNMAVWDGTPDAAIELHAMIFNAATFVRNMQLDIRMSSDSAAKLLNARISTAGAPEMKAFQANTLHTLSNMLPGERRWVTLSADGINAKEGEVLTVYFNELENKTILNGYALEIRPTTTDAFYAATLRTQADVFYRLAEGFGIKKAGEGAALSRKLAERHELKDYLRGLPQMLEMLRGSFNAFSEQQGGAKDVFQSESLFRLLSEPSRNGNVNKILGVHNRLLRKLDAWLSMAQMSKGDLGSILFTVRLQHDLFSRPVFRSSPEFAGLIKMSDDFIARFRGDVANYVPMVRELMGVFKLSLTQARNRTTVVVSRLEALRGALESNNAAYVQKAHLDFLNALLQASVVIKLPNPPLPLTFPHLIDRTVPKTPT